MNERKEGTLRTRIVNATITTLAVVDGFILTQPRNIVLSYKETGLVRGTRDALLPMVLFPAIVGALTYAVTRRAEVAVVATGLAYIGEGFVMDFCEAIGYAQSTSAFGENLYGRWTYPLQRRLAGLNNYPKGTDIL